MIDVRDLMLGNYLECGGDLLEVICIYGDGHGGVVLRDLVSKNIKQEDESQFLQFINPITITLEWLEKLGFEWLDKKHGVLEKGFFTAYTKATSKTRGCVFEANFIPGDAFCVARFEVEYIHDLQNLMHSTTKAAIKLEDWE